MNSRDWLRNYNILQGDFTSIFSFGGATSILRRGLGSKESSSPPLDPLAAHINGRHYCHMKKWGPMQRYLWIKKIIKLHTQQSLTWRLIIATPLLLHLLDNDSTLYLVVSHLHHHSWRPIETEQNLNFSLVTTFVNISVGFWLVCIFPSFNYPSSNIDHMKWYLRCLCLALEWNAEFFARCMALWLSLYDLPNSYFLPNSSRNLCNQIISLLASLATTYSGRRWECNNTLHFWNPTDSCSTYSKHIPCGAPPVISITRHNCINISL